MGHVCCRAFEAGPSRKGAGAVTMRTRLDSPPERSVLALQRTNRTSERAESSAFHVKPASEHSTLRADGEDLQFLRSRVGVLQTHDAAALVHPLRTQRTANHDACIAGQGFLVHTRVPHNRNMEHAHPTQRDHVSRETGRQPRPLADSACLSQVHWARALLRFILSSCASRDSGRARNGVTTHLVCPAFR